MTEPTAEPRQWHYGSDKQLTGLTGGRGDGLGDVGRWLQLHEFSEAAGLHAAGLQEVLQLNLPPAGGGHGPHGRRGGGPPGRGRVHHLGHCYGLSGGGAARGRLGHHDRAQRRELVELVEHEGGGGGLGLLLQREGREEGER